MLVFACKGLRKVSLPVQKGTIKQTITQSINQSNDRSSDNSTR